MLARALQQLDQAVQTALGPPHLVDRYVWSHLLFLSPTNPDREDGLFDQEQHRCIASPSQTDPPSVLF